MKILVSWLRDFVYVTAPPEELGQRLSMAGFELSEIGVREPFSAGSSEKGSRTPISDAVLDFEILANRPDCLSVIGLAREAATAYSLPLRALGSDPGTVRGSDPLALKKLQTGATDVTVRLEAPDLCPRYSAAVVDVTIGPSPDWLAARLQACGVRPI